MLEGDSTNHTAPDPLAEIVRAAGRREAPPRSHYDQVYAASRTVWQRKVRAHRRNRWFAMAAAVAIATSGGVLAYLVQTGDAGLAATVAISEGTVVRRAADSSDWEQITGNGSMLPVGARLRTAPQGRAALVLAEGGSLRIGADTEVEFGLDAIELSAGTVYFDSQGRAQATGIRIDTPLGKVFDIGTQFEVNLQGGRLRIRVREGQVAVLDSPVTDEIVTAVGDELELSEELVSRGSIATDDGAWAWAEALASVPDSPAQSILTYFRWIARETGKRLEFESDAVALAAELSRFGGDPAGLSPRGLLSSIAATSDFRYSLTSDGAILIGRN